MMDKAVKIPAHLVEQVRGLYPHMKDKEAISHALQAFMHCRNRDLLSEAVGLFSPKEITALADAMGSTQRQPEAMTFEVIQANVNDAELTGRDLATTHGVDTWVLLDKLSTCTPGMIWAILDDIQCWRDNPARQKQGLANLTAKYGG